MLLVTLLIETLPKKDEIGLLLTPEKRVNHKIIKQMVLDLMTSADPMLINVLKEITLKFVEFFEMEI